MVLVSHVADRAGYLADAAVLTRMAHEAGGLIVWDLGHSAGSVPVHADAWRLDAAVGCTYKYLNGGPGAPAGLFVNRRHFGRAPGLAGWFGYVKERQFDMSITFEHAQSAGGWQMGTPCVLSAATLDGELTIWQPLTLRFSGPAAAERDAEAILRNVYLCQERGPNPRPLPRGKG